jgi:hypothetical protein
LRRPRPTQGCGADDDDDDDDDDDGCLFIITELNRQLMTPMYKVSLLNTARLIIKCVQAFLMIVITTSNQFTPVHTNTRFRLTHSSKPQASLLTHAHNYH